MDWGRSVNLTLTYAEVFVLAHLLGRWENDGTTDSLPYEDAAELQAMWSLTAALERHVDEAFASNYDEFVAAARQTLRSKDS